MFNTLWRSERGLHRHVGEEYQAPTRTTAFPSVLKTIVADSTKTIGQTLPNMLTKEVDKHKAQNICFYYHKLYSMDHDCPQRFCLAPQFMDLGA